MRGFQQLHLGLVQCPDVVVFLRFRAGNRMRVLFRIDSFRRFG